LRRNRDLMSKAEFHRDLIVSLPSVSGWRETRKLRREDDFWRTLHDAPIRNTERFPHRYSMIYLCHGQYL